MAWENIKLLQVGEVSGSVTAAQLPARVANLVKIKAVSTNAGQVYLGLAGVTKANGTTDITTGMELGAGEDTGLIPVDNLSDLYIICDNATDDIVYMIFG